MKPVPNIEGWTYLFPKKRLFFRILRFKILRPNPKPRLLSIQPKLSKACSINGLHYQRAQKERHTTLSRYCGGWFTLGICLFTIYYVLWSGIHGMFTRSRQPKQDIKRNKRGWMWKTHISTNLSKHLFPAFGQKWVKGIFGILGTFSLGP